MFDVSFCIVYYVLVHYTYKYMNVDCIYVELNGFVIHTTTDINLHVYNKICRNCNR